ncbi:DNA-processing protein DprA [Streptomyces barkulensis]|uniref:DNA-processing protein DprA n=1 Tax=Streptomyces barkulensis TaxID=1257026 RepID=UPI000C6D0736|nr:DNA-processing protein DprA [Streptomyces barkulensis]
MVTERQRRLLTLCALRHEGTGLDWKLLARTCQRPDGLDSLFSGHIPERSAAARKALPVLRATLPSLHEERDRVEAEIEAAERAGARLVTVLDDDYPANLRLVPDLPPFLFVRGGIVPEDARSVAVVGTRQVTEEGRRRAARMARGLAREGVVVVSGLARGVDTAAHTAALETGGRTVAVIGTGIAAPTYPPENRALAERLVAEGGAVVSQFWPTSGPARWTFPRRNVTMSGFTQGTVVIEAARTSGAKMQARIAADHGKRVFLLRSLVAQQQWAMTMLERGRAKEVRELADVLSDLASAERVQRAGEQRQQLALAVL